MTEYELKCEKNKPRICEVLDVEVNQCFSINKDECNGYIFRIAEDGRRQYRFKDSKRSDDWTNDADESILTEIINRPELIIRKPFWKAEDVTDAKAIRRLWPMATHIVANKIGEKTIIDRGNRCRTYGHLGINAVRSLKPGATASIDEILESEDGE